MTPTPPPQKHANNCGPQALEAPPNRHGQVINVGKKPPQPAQDKTNRGFSVSAIFIVWNSACAPTPPPAVKTCAERPVFARVVGELRAANPSKCPRAHEAKCQPMGTIWGSDTKVEAGAGPAPRARKPGQSAHAESQARKRNPNLNFLVRIFSGGTGVFHMKGWGPKSSVCPSKPGKSNFFGGISRDFAGISRRRLKSLRKKVCVQFSFPRINPGGLSLRNAYFYSVCKHWYQLVASRVDLSMDREVDLTTLKNLLWGYVYPHEVMHSLKVVFIQPQEIPFQTTKWPIIYQGKLINKGTELRWQRAPKTQIFAENRRFSQIHPFSWKFQHLEGAGNRRKPQIFAENRRFSQKTAGNRRLGSVTLGASPLARP